MANIKTAVEQMKTEAERLSGEPPISDGDFLRRRSLRTPLLRQIETALRGQAARTQVILRERTFSSTPSTLAELASKLGITRERVRQIEVKAVGAIVDVDGNLGGLVDERLRGFRAGRSLPLALSELERLDEWFAGATENTGMFDPLLRLLGCDHRMVLVDSRAESFIAPTEAADMTALVEWFVQALGNSQRSSPEKVARKLLSARGAVELLPVLLAEAGEIVDTGSKSVLSPGAVANRRHPRPTREEWGCLGRTAGRRGVGVPASRLFGVPQLEAEAVGSGVRVRRSGHRHGCRKSDPEGERWADEV